MWTPKIATVQGESDEDFTGSHQNSDRQAEGVTGSHQNSDRQAEGVTGSHQNWRRGEARGGAAQKTTTRHSGQGNSKGPTLREGPSGMG